MTESLTELLNLVEKATGPDRELDLVLWATFVPEDYWATFTNQPAFTASLDAALALCERVLPGAYRELSEQQAEEGNPNARCWIATICWPGKRESFEGEAKTPALALLAAMLKALIAGDQS